MISVELRVVGGKHGGQIIPLDRKKFLIGREADCQLRPNSELVSRHHCVFTVDDFSVRLRDLGSTNGTVVNGERIRKEVVLNPGDHVVVGSLEFEIAVNEVSDVSGTTGKLSAVSEETVVAGSDTLTEIPAESPDTGMPQEQPVAGDGQAPVDVGKTAVDQPQQAAAAPQAAPAAEQTPSPNVTMPDLMQPGSGTGDTTVIAQPVMMPGQTPYQPMMPQQPMGYPPMYGNYPYPGMPGQMPMYPPQQQPFQQPMPGYPQQHMPGQMPPQQQPAPAPPAAAEPPAGGTQTADGLNVSLPDPSETGAKAPAPPAPAASAENKGEAADDPASNQSAADIIQQHMQRRPGG